MSSFVVYCALSWKFPGQFSWEPQDVWTPTSCCFPSLSLRSLAPWVVCRPGRVPRKLSISVCCLLLLHELLVLRKVPSMSDLLILNRRTLPSPPDGLGTDNGDGATCSWVRASRGESEGQPRGEALLYGPSHLRGGSASSSFCTLSTFQTRKVQSSAAEASCKGSVGHHATVVTSFSCPDRT